MRRYVLFKEGRGFFWYDTLDRDFYSKDINKAAIFHKNMAEEYQQEGDKIVPVEVDIRLA